jgi:hypothetical protein
LTSVAVALSSTNGTLSTTTPGPITFTGVSGLVTTTPPEIPLPATLPLFASGLGALGLLGWRRKRKSTASVLAA